MLDALGSFAQDHPYATVSIVLALAGGPIFGTRSLQAGRFAQRDPFSLPRKAGLVAAWFAFFVFIVHKWPTVQRIGRWVVLALLGVATVIAYLIWPGRIVMLVGLTMMWGGILWFRDWIGGSHVEITLANIQAAKRKHRITQVIRHAAATVTHEGAPPQVSMVEEHNGHSRVHIEPGIGESLGDLMTRADTGAFGNAIRRLGPRYGVDDLTVTSSQITPDGTQEGEGALTIYDGDPLEEIVRPPDSWPTDVDAPVSLGRDIDGGELTVDIDAEFSMLVGGLKGQGKSSFIAAILDQLARRTDTAIVLTDPKRMEFAQWVDRASMVGLGRLGTDLAIRFAYCEYLHRTTVLAAAAGYVRKNRTGVDFPRLVLVSDEMAEMSSTKPKGEERDDIKYTLETYFGDLSESPEAWSESCQEVYRMIITLTRATGFTTVGATQRPSTTVLPANIRDNHDLAVGFAMRDRTTTGMVFGETAPPCWLIPPKHRGVGYALTQESRTAVKFRSPLIDDARIAETVKATRGLRVDLGWPRTIERPIKPPVEDLDED